MRFLIQIAAQVFSQPSALAEERKSEKPDLHSAWPIESKSGAASEFARTCKSQNLYTFFRSDIPPLLSSHLLQHRPDSRPCLLPDSAVPHPHRPQHSKQQLWQHQQQLWRHQQLQQRWQPLSKYPRTRHPAVLGLSVLVRCTVCTRCE